ncbi:hypothetical protein CDL15_Pgr020480 [Punica granatum]|uniref:Protein RALF-like 33 n=1 Tax=Punica granatum TaxID=22663 RepID=A0A218VW20_PUNGR|nr:hypothetical protein CDL15_Pgr020480 [Punica granatum]PKI43211.1 hypothetical protein CRG98_036408 [Punica granatum]
MAKGCLFGARPGFQQFLALAAATLVLLLLSMPFPGAAEQQRSSMIMGNSSLCSGIDVDGEDGGCALAIAQAHPELEGFEMAADLGMGVLRRLATVTLDVGKVAEGTRVSGKAACDRVKMGQRYSCTTDPNLRAVPCPMFRRDCR